MRRSKTRNSDEIQLNILEQPSEMWYKVRFVSRDVARQSVAQIHVPNTGRRRKEIAFILCNGT